ncbi:MAG TPA: diacylglycerol kinase family protein [Mycobacteriales bacterium]|nr:diacylglycerol kinase family protein [Mycobacteriales bacterium]
MDVRPTRAQVWLARSAFGAAFGAAVVLVVFAGLRSLAMVLVGVVGVTVFVAAVYWFLARRGVLRWVAAAVALAAPVAMLVLYVRAQLLWVALLSLAVAVLAGIAGRAALSVEAGDQSMPTYPARPVRHPFLVMNPRSGGGKVARFGLREKAEALGAEVALLDGPGIVDVDALARDAVTRGADLLGVAGGDGTQALVAGIAAEHGLPFLVVSAGTRNHFALDLGLDRDDPANCLDGLTDGLELRVDLGVIAGRTFVNNASFGAYAQIVQSPAYRDDKAGTTLEMLPDLLAGHRGPRLVVRTAGVTIDGPQAVLVSSGPYETGDVAGLGRRARLDYGVLGIVVVSVATARQAVGLLRRNHRRGLALLTATDVVVDADQPEIPVGIDGEAIVLPTPVRCTTLPKALRVRVPRDRPGVPAPRPVIDWVRLRRLASGRG